MPLTPKEILEKEVWPRAKAVFGYVNRKTPKTTTDKLMELRRTYSAANCSYIASFIDIIQFDEAVHRFAVSYNFSLVPCLPGDFKGNLSQEIDAELLQHDLLVGSRYQTECATSWLDTIIKSGQALDSDELQLIDKIFGSAIHAKAGPPLALTRSDLVDIANGFRWMQDYPAAKIH